MIGACQIVFATPEQATKDTNLQVFDELYSRGLFALATIDEHTARLSGGTHSAQITCIWD